MECLGMSKTDWITQYKKEIEDLKTQKEEWNKFSQEAQNNEVKIDIQQRVLWIENQLNDYERRIKNLA